jgi:hypothetical protein
LEDAHESRPNGSFADARGTAVSPIADAGAKGPARGGLGRSGYACDEREMKQLDGRRSMTAMGKLLRVGRLLAAPVFRPRLAFAAIEQYPSFLRDWWAYQRMDGAEPVSPNDWYPQLLDRTSTTPFDSHYFYMNGWAARQILSALPQFHVDVGSDIMFVNLLAASVPVQFLDYRPLVAKAPGLASLSADILALPYASNSIESLSCLHVAEHVGLGRYGDALDPAGTRKAAQALSRCLAPGGALYFAVPVGRERVCFNAHRVHRPATIRQYFAGLELAQFAAVDDAGVFHDSADLASYDDADYACGLFVFRKPTSAGAG